MDIENNVRYENPGLEVELLDLVADLFRRHGLDGGNGGRALAAAVVVRWQYDSGTTDRFVVYTSDDDTAEELFEHGLSTFD